MGRDARLQVPRSIGFKLLRGQLVEDLIICKVDLELRRLSVTLLDPFSALQDVTMVGMPALQPTPPPEANPREKPSPNLPSLRLSAAKGVSLSIGDVVNGVVTGVNNRGAFVDVGAEKLSKLQISQELKDLFKKGDRVHGMVVEKISPGGVAILSLEDPELDVENVPDQRLIEPPISKA